MIKLEKVSKIYRLTEVETHAISEIDLEITQGEFLAVMGPSVPASPRCCTSLGCLDTRGRAPGVISWPGRT